MTLIFSRCQANPSDHSAQVMVRQRVFGPLPSFLTRANCWIYDAALLEKSTPYLVGWKVPCIPESITSSYKPWDRQRREKAQSKTSKEQETEHKNTWSKCQETIPAPKHQPLILTTANGRTSGQGCELPRWSWSAGQGYQSGQIQTIKKCLNHDGQNLTKNENRIMNQLQTKHCIGPPSLRPCCHD